MRPAYDLDPAFRDVLSTLRAREGDGPPLFSPGERLLAAARRFARTPDDCARFAVGVRLFSVNPAIAPLEPGEMKDALFVGDALHAASFVAPIDGIRYRAAERWPSSGLFQPVGPAWARPGDLLIVDRRVEVITEVSERSPRVITLGARGGGLVEDETYGRALVRARRPTRWRLGGAPVHVLRLTVHEP